MKVPRLVSDPAAGAKADAPLPWERRVYQRLLTNPAELDARLATGDQHASQRANGTLARAAAMGL